MLSTWKALRTWADIESHPKLGASWEGFVISQVATLLDVRPDECFFWATHAGAGPSLPLCAPQLPRISRQQFGSGSYEFKETTIGHPTHSSSP